MLPLIMLVDILLLYHELNTQQWLINLLGCHFVRRNLIYQFNVCQTITFSAWYEVTLKIYYWLMALANHPSLLQVKNMITDKKSK